MGTAPGKRRPWWHKECRQLTPEQKERVAANRSYHQQLLDGISRDAAENSLRLVTAHRRVAREELDAAGFPRNYEARSPWRET